MSGAEVRGRVLDSAGQAVAGAYLRCVGTREPKASGTVLLLDEMTRTDDDGAFRVTVEPIETVGGKTLPPESQYLSVIAYTEDGGYGWLNGWAETLTAGEQTLQLVPSTTISGEVVDEDGNPVAGASVAVTDRQAPLHGDSAGMAEPVAPGQPATSFWVAQWRKWDGPHSTTAPEMGPRHNTPSAQTGADGRFELTGAPQGVPLALSVEHAGHAPRICSREQIELEPVVLLPGATITLRLQAPAGIDPAGATIIATMDSGLTGGHAQADADGLVTLSGLQPGDYTLRLLRNAGTRLAMPAVRVDALKAGETREISPDCRTGTVLHGRVVSWFRGKPLAGADVRFEADTGYPPTSATYQAACTDADGYYRFPFAVPPIAIRIVATWVCPATGKQRRSRITTIDLPDRPDFEHLFRL